MAANANEMYASLAPQIQALSKYYNIPIHVIQRGPPMILAHSPDETGKSGPITSEESLACGKAVRISYHRRMYGLGEVSGFVASESLLHEEGSYCLLTLPS